MLKEEVPQDQGIADGLKEVTYAVDDKGDYVMVPSAGWEPKNISNYQAWEVIAEQIETARCQVLNDEVSPLAYHMARNQMDISLLPSIWESCAGGSNGTLNRRYLKN